VLSTYDSQFGSETLITLEPSQEHRGQYGLRTITGKYINVDNSGGVNASKTAVDDSCLFTFEFQWSSLFIRSVSTGNYLTAQGSGLKAIRNVISVKDIFTIQLSDAQITLKANNKKFVSVQGTNLISRDTATTHAEIFVLEGVQDKVALKTVDQLYWSVKDNMVSIDSKERTASELFTLEYHEDKVAIKAPNGKYLTAKPLGGIDAKASAAGPQELYEMRLLNRSQIVFQAQQQSFIGSGPDGKLRTNRAVPETLLLEFKDGKYSIKTRNGQYLKELEDKKMGLSDQPDIFYLEYQMEKLAIKTEKGKYLKSENQGWLLATEDKIGATELFEF